MALKSLVVYLIFFLFTTSLAQAQSYIDIFPHWETNETHAIKFKATTSVTNEGKTEDYVSTFDAKYVIKEATGHRYKLEWTYSNFKLAADDPSVENQIFARMRTVRLLVELSRIGRFKRLLNVDEVKAEANKAVDQLLVGSTATPSMIAEYQAAKRLVSTKAGLEIWLLKQIKFCNSLYGYRYKTTAVRTSNFAFRNPLGGKPFKATEKIQLTKFDTTNSICVIEIRNTVDEAGLKSCLLDYVRTSDPGQKTIPINYAALELTEDTIGQINFATGTIQKESFKTVMNLGISNRTTLWEMETAD